MCRHHQCKVNCRISGEFQIVRLDKPEACQSIRTISARNKAHADSTRRPFLRQTEENDFPLYLVAYLGLVGCATGF